VGVAIITGSAGLIGSEACKFFAKQGLDIVGIDNNMRQFFFGADGSTNWNRQQLEKSLGTKYYHLDVDNSRL
jgi:CDP-paratose 2-epimerase